MNQVTTLDFGWCGVRFSVHLLFLPTALLFRLYLGWSSFLAIISETTTGEQMRRRQDNTERVSTVVDVDLIVAMVKNKRTRTETGHKFLWKSTRLGTWCGMLKSY